MAFLDALFNGLLLGGVYSLIALGLTLQYGISRILNLSYGEFLIAACFAAYWLFSSLSVNPLLGLLVIVPLAFVLNWLIYQVLLTPLVRRSRTKGSLELNSILVTFGLLFVVQGTFLLIFGGGYTSYSFLDGVVILLGSPLAIDRIVAVAFAAAIGVSLYLVLTRTRFGTSVRAVAVNPKAASLVGINVHSIAALTFALGGGLVATSGVLVSTFITFNASMGVVFTMKALMVVIMGGVGNLMGCLVAGLMLGLAESFVGTYIDNGLTLAVTFAIFLVVLLFRPEGLFGRAAT